MRTKMRKHRKWRAGLSWFFCLTRRREKLAREAFDNMIAYMSKRYEDQVERAFTGALMTGSSWMTIAPTGEISFVEPDHLRSEP